MSPLVAQPAYVFLDGLDVFHVLLGGVGVVEAQVADASVGGRDAEVQANSFGVSDVEISVRLRREAGLYTAPVLAFAQVVLYYLFNEVQTFLLAVFFVLPFCHSVIIYNMV